MSSSTSSPRRAILSGLIFCFLVAAALGLLLAAGAGLSLARGVDASSKIYLPCVVRAGASPASTRTAGSSTPTVTRTATRTPIPPTRTVTRTPTRTMVPATRTATPTATPKSSGVGAFFLGTSSAQTEHADVAVDAAGGRHVVYLGYEDVFSSGPPKPAYYAYCPPGADCANVANWRAVQLNLPTQAAENEWSDIELAVGPGRVAFIAFAQTWPALQPRTLVYAECSANCAQSAANWRTFAALQNPDNTNFSGRVFALDLQGHPHYVYHKWGDGLNKELHLLSCDAANCAAAAGWHDLTIASESYAFEDEYLAYTADGKIRLVCTHAGDTEIAPDETLGFSYWECDSGCTTSATGWRRVHIYPSDYPMGFALGPQGQPRALIYGSGNYGASPAIQPDTYNYVWCNTNCLSAGNWHASTIGSPAGEVPDIYQQESTRLAIDGTGRPYVAYYYEDPQTYDNTGLRWYYCPQNCQVEGNNAANWHKQFIETVRTLDASDPIPVEPGYLVSVWSHPGRFPRLAFDVAGNVQTVYGNWHQQMRWNGSSIESYVDLALARLRLLKRP